MGAPGMDGEAGDDAWPMMINLPEPDIATSALAPQSGEIIPDGLSAYVPDHYEIASGMNFEIGNNAFFEIG
jgi:hypothetical protein